jgi:hypothetical protein
LAEALKLFKQAIEFEETGRINEALMLYRQASKLHPEVEKVAYAEQNRKEDAKVAAAAAASNGTLSIGEARCLVCERIVVCTRISLSDPLCAQ